MNPRNIDEKFLQLLNLLRQQEGFVENFIQILKDAKERNKLIDPDLDPIWVSGDWILDGMISTNRAPNKLMGEVNIGKVIR